MFAADALRFSYPGQPEPYQFTMQSLPGEITAVSGASGSGKSTLLDLLAGFARPSSGTIMLDDTNITALPPERRPLSLLLQSESLFEHLSTARNVDLGLPPTTPREAANAAIASALEEVGLTGLGSQKAATLSGGQKQRTALARTLLRNRPVLLLDEPFSALDDTTRGTIRTLVRDLTIRHGWHTILVSHHVDDVVALATRCYQLENRQLHLA